MSLVSLGRSGPGVRSGFLETPRTRFGGVFLASAKTASQFAVSRHVRVASGAAQRRLEWFAQVREGLTLRGRSHPGLRPLANLRFEVSRLLPAVSSKPDVAAARRALGLGAIGEETPQPFEHIDHPLPDGDGRDDAVDAVGRGLRHAASIARRAHAAAPAGPAHRLRRGRRARSRGASRRSGGGASCGAGGARNARSAG